MDRGKQPEKLVRLFSELKRAGASVRLIIASFHSTGQHFVDYRDDIRAEAHRLGLADDEVIFTNCLGSLPGIPARRPARGTRSSCRTRSSWTCST